MNSKDPIEMYCPVCSGFSDVHSSDLLELPIRTIREAEKNGGRVIEVCSRCEGAAIVFTSSECPCGGTACPSCSPLEYI